MRRVRTACFFLVVVVAAGGCGSPDMPLTEYVELLDAIPGGEGETEVPGERAVPGRDYTPQDLQADLERTLREICIPYQAAVDAIDPPQQIAELHHLMWDWHAEFVSAEKALAARAAIAENNPAGWAALSASPEMNAYRDSMVEGKKRCRDIQAALDATAARGAFADTPWIPAKLREVVDYVIGCEVFPEHPENLYRYPPEAAGS